MSTWRAFRMNVDSPDIPPAQKVLIVDLDQISHIDNIGGVVTLSMKNGHKLAVENNLRQVSNMFLRRDDP